MSGASRAPIPNSVRKTIQDIKEIAGNHSDEEIYAMLRECSMDPNETAQKLLFQDTFHEVKRKRDKRKENFREVADTRWRPAIHGRGGRSGRGNFTPRFSSHDIDSRRNISTGKENGTCGDGSKGFTPISSSMPLATEDNASIKEHKSTISSSLPNGPKSAEHQSSVEPSVICGGSIEGLSTVVVTMDKSLLGEVKIPLSSSGNSSSSTTIVSASGVYASSSDPVLLPSFDGHAQGAVGAIKREIRTPRSVVDASVGRGVCHDIRGSELSSLHQTVISENSGNFGNGKVQENFQEIVSGHVPETHQVASPSSSITGTSGSRPSSNYSNRSQNPSASIRAGPAKEWKPKSTNVNSATVSGTFSTSAVDFHKEEAVTSSMPVSNPMVPNDYAKTQKKLEEFVISDAKHVIIPDHLQVSESERCGLSFGSFNSILPLAMRFNDEPDTEESPGESSESSKDIEENVEEFPSSVIDSPKVTEENNDKIEEQPVISGNQSEEIDIPCSISLDTNNEPKLEAPLASGLQHSIIHNTPVYPNFGFVPPLIGSHFPAFESAEAQSHETARIPSFVVPQAFDPSASYYASIYRPAIDGDGRFSPLLAQSTSTKFNGTVAALSNQTAQSLQESGSSLVLSSAGSAPLVPQPAGVVQTSIASGQQPIPLFRQPAGVHISHYPPNYVHYSQYFSPFYAPPPAAIHHFLGNTAAFHQQASTGNIFPLPTANTGTNHVKYPLSQYKPGTNSGPPGQGTYGLNPFVYNPAAVSGGNSAGSDDLTSSQFKENSVFNNGQQGEGSAIWMSPGARDISAFQAGSFYNVPPQAQPVAFTPTQPGHGAAAFAGMYHPSQSVTAGPIHPLLQQPQPVGGSSEMGGPPVGVYPQPHRASQINWVNNY